MATYDLTYQRATTPTAGPMTGTLHLQSFVESKWPDSWSKGIFAPRPIRGTEHLTPKRWSIHAEGRALDIGVALDVAGEVLGDEIADWIITHAAEIGCQYFIWNQRSWSKHRGWTPYTGKAGGHRDHLHVEQTSEAARLVRLADLQTLDASLTPMGTDTRTGFRFEGLRPIRSYLKVAGGVVFMADNGDMYCPTTRYFGGPNDEILGRDYVVLGESDTLVENPAHPDGYIVMTTDRRAYGYP